MDLKCPKCGVPQSQEDIFCSKCGLRIRSSNDGRMPDDSFRAEALDLLETLNEFRIWISQRKKINVRFMKIYKQKIEDEIGPPIRQFKEKYGKIEEKQVKLFELIQEIFTCFRRPVRFMETKLRPSVGIGVWQERWMMTKAVEDYLKACCQEADRHLGELIREMERTELSD